MPPMTFTEALAKSSASTSPLTFGAALAVVEKAHFRHGDGKFRTGVPVPLADLEDIEATVPDDDEQLLDAMAKFQAGEVPPPIDIAVDPEGNKALVRGKKRLAAARKTGQATIPVRFTQVTEEFGKADAAAATTNPPRTLQPIDDKTSFPPFPFDQTIFSRIRPDQVPRFLGVLTDRERWPLQTVKLADLIAMQNRVDTGKVQAKVANGGGGHEPIVVMLEPGRYHIADGHHDLAAAWLRGEDEKAVRFADLTAVTNVLKAADTPLAAGTPVRIKDGAKVGFPFDQIGRHVGEVLVSYIVAEGPKVGVTAAWVEWLTPDFMGMVRGIALADLEVAVDQLPAPNFRPADGALNCLGCFWRNGDSESCERYKQSIDGNSICDGYTGTRATDLAKTLRCAPDVAYARAQVAKAAAKLPAVGDIIDFDDDRFTDKGPASGPVAAVISNTVIVNFGDGYPEDLALIDWLTVTKQAKAERWTKPSGKVWWSVHGKPDDQQERPQGGEVAKTSSAAPDHFTLSATICKVDQEERLVFGFFSIVEVDGKPVTDNEGDRISPAELEKAAYGHVLNARIASDTHTRVGVGDLVESCVLTVEKQQAMQSALVALGIPAVIDLHCVAWWGGYHVTDDKVWQAIKNEDYVSFSIGGSGTRTPAADA